MSQPEIQALQQPEEEADEAGLADGCEAGRWTRSGDGVHEAKNGDRKIQPVGNDAMTKIDQRHGAAEHAERAVGTKDLQSFAINRRRRHGK